MTELTFALLKYGFLILLWVFVWLAVRSLYKDIESFSPRPSRARRRKNRRALKAASAPVATAPEPPRHSASASNSQGNRSLGGEPTLLVVIDGPLAGSSVPLGGDAITLGRAASNTVVLDDEFVSSHHARLYCDRASGQWVIEDLDSTNGTVVGEQRLSSPVILPAGLPVRIGATTFELR